MIQISILVTMLQGLGYSQIFTLPHKITILFYYEEDIIRFLRLSQTKAQHTGVAEYLSSCNDRLRELPLLASKVNQVK